MGDDLIRLYIASIISVDVMTGLGHRGFGTPAKKQHSFKLALRR
jgi:hypothetical protein